MVVLFVRCRLVSAAIFIPINKQKLSKQTFDPKQSIEITISSWKEKLFQLWNLELEIEALNFQN